MRVVCSERRGIGRRLLPGSSRGREYVLSVEELCNSLDELTEFNGGNHRTSVIAIYDATLVFIEPAISREALEALQIPAKRLSVAVKPLADSGSH